MKIMGVDYGDVRTGIAVCDELEILASPAGVITGNNMNDVAKKVAEAAKEHRVKEIVVGYPLNMDGSAGDRAKKCQTFGNKVNAMAGIPVRMWDERNTTVSAHGYLRDNNVRGQKRKKVVDAVAATIILDSYLRYRELNK